MLFIQLTHHQLSEPVAAKLLAVCQALQSRQLDAASSHVQELTTQHFTETGGWVLGLKRLIDLAKA